jgi:hypothetical protein
MANARDSYWAWRRRFAEVVGGLGERAVADDRLEITATGTQDTVEDGTEDLPRGIVIARRRTNQDTVDKSNRSEGRARLFDDGALLRQHRDGIFGFVERGAGAALCSESGE